MAAESSFDIVSRLNRQEVDNALNQAAKEIGTRFDFRGVGAAIAWSGDHAVDIRANSEERAKAVLDVFKDKLVKRGVSLKALDPGDPKPPGGSASSSGMRDPKESAPRCRVRNCAFRPRRRTTCRW